MQELTKSHKDLLLEMAEKKGLPVEEIERQLIRQELDRQAALEGLCRNEQEEKSQ